MKRKVVKQGHNALTITLPAEWTKENRVKSGDEIDIKINGKELLIQKDSSILGEKTTFQMIGDGKFLHRHLAVLYRLGYDEVSIEFDNPGMINKIQYEIEGLLGFEIVDQGENYCVIKNIASGLENEFDNILRKIFLNLLYCGEKGLEMIKQKKYKNLESLKQLARVNNRQTNFCERMLKKEGYKEHKKTLLIYTMVWALEQVEDYYSNIFNYLLIQEKEPKTSREILSIYESVNKILKNYYELFYSQFDSHKVSNLKEKCLELINEMKVLLEKKNKSGADAILILNLNLIAERIYHMTESLI